MTERGVCICPECGCQFSDDQKAKYERMALRLDWRRRPFYRLRVWRLSKRLTKLTPVASAAQTARAEHGTQGTGQR